MKESELLADDDNYFGANLRVSGYHFSFVRNMMVILAIATLIALVWMITAVMEIVRR